MFSTLYVEVAGICNLMEEVPADPVAPESPEMGQSKRVDQPSTSVRDELEEPALIFIAELPHPDRNAPKGSFRHGEFSITYYDTPRSIGEFEANLSSPFRYPQVAIVEVEEEPVLLMRTEEGSYGAA